MKHLCLLGLAAVALGGCATPYQPMSLIGGYRDHPIAADRYKVSFIGNGYTLDDMALDYAEMRGAELCQKAGYSHFSVISTDVEHIESENRENGPPYTTIVSPTARVEVQCGNDPASFTYATATFIAQMRSRYSKAGS